MPRIAVGLAAFLLLAAPAGARGAVCEDLKPLRASGTMLTTDSGQPVELRGVNFGNWLVIESAFLGEDIGDESSLWALLESRFGKAGMEQAREAYRSAWITPADFERVRALGLNSVRIPFWYGLLEDDAHPGEYSEAGWKWLDMAVESCERACIYCVLDLHGAPGGQSAADHTGAAGRNGLWDHPDMQKRAAAIWAAVAARYRGRASIAAFDLLNEPMGAPNKKAIVSINSQLIDAVRSADKDRLVVVEDGYRGLDGFPGPSEAGWSGVIYSQHHYATMNAPWPTAQMHEAYIRTVFPASRREQKRLGAPIYVGEWSVIQEAAGGGSMTSRYIKEMGREGWSWALWIYKQTSSERVRECWSFYRNDKPMSLPDFKRDSLQAILGKIEGLRTENMSLYGALRDAVKTGGCYEKGLDIRRIDLTREISTRALTGLSR